MSLDTITPENKKRITDFIDAGVKITQEITDLRQGLADTAKALGEELDIKPTLLKKAVRVAFKASLADEKENIDTVEDLLHVSGHS